MGGACCGGSASVPVDGGDKPTNQSSSTIEVDKKTPTESSTISKQEPTANDKPRLSEDKAVVKEHGTSDKQPVASVGDSGRATPIFEEYEPPPPEWCRWRRSPAIGRFVPLRNPLSVTQVNEIKEKVEATIAEFEAAVGALHSHICKCNVDTVQHAELEAWFNGVQTKQVAVTACEQEMMGALRKGLNQEQALEMNLMSIRHHLVILNSVGVGQSQWAAAIMEANLNTEQRAQAVEALSSLTSALTARKERLNDLCNAADRCLRYGESRDNMAALTTEMEDVASKEVKETATLATALQAPLTVKHKALFLAWLFGIKSLTDFRPVWAAKVANLQRSSPFGRYLPSFEVLTPLQVDAISHTLHPIHGRFNDALKELAGAAKALEAAEDSGIPAAVAEVASKRDSVKAIESEALAALLTHFETAQRAEVAAMRTRQAVAHDEQEPPLWWQEAVKGLSEEQNTKAASAMSDLTAAKDELQPLIAEVESRLPNAQGIDDALNKLEEGEKKLESTTNEVEKRMLALLEPSQQKSILLAVLKSFVAC